MIIRKTEYGDLAAVMQIYAEARAFMRANGNPTQWRDGTPERELIEQDIQGNKSYVCVNSSDEVIAVFYFKVEREPVYDTLDGKWLNNLSDNNADIYGVIHRIAKSGGAPKGVGGFCINWCFEQCSNIKIDTHENNAPMLKLLDNLGFTYCGVVHYPDGGKRIAFQKRE